MKMKQKFTRRNLIFNFVAVSTAISLATYSFAATDYERIRKDINIMIGIVKSSFEDSADCRKCRVKITGSYLAEQGVVFNVNPSGNYTHGYKYVYDYDYNYDYPDFTSDIALVTEGIAEIPEMVHEILADVRVNLNSENMHSWSMRAPHDDGDLADHTRELREEMREFRADQREFAREMREIEIESIHAEEDELADLEAREGEVKQKLAEMEKKQLESQKKFESYADKRIKDRESKRAQRAEVQEQQFKKMETIVLNTFCDYGSTIRSLPDNERVSVVVNNGDESNVYVFKQSQLASCDSSKTDVRKNALSYVF